MFDEMNAFSDYEIEERDLVEALFSNDVGGELICDADDDGEHKALKGKVMETTKVVWIIPITTFSSVKSSYIRYANGEFIEYSYGDICLVVQVRLLDERKKTVERAGNARSWEGSLPEEDISSAMEHGNRELYG